MEPRGIEPLTSCMPCKRSVTRKPLRSKGLWRYGSDGTVAVYGIIRHDAYGVPSEIPTPP